MAVLNGDEVLVEAPLQALHPWRRQGGLSGSSMRCAFGLGALLANSVTSQEPPKIVFPAPAYPVKVVGGVYPGFRSLYWTLFQAHAPGRSAGPASRSALKKRSLLAVTVTFTAQPKGSSRRSLRTQASVVVLSSSSELTALWWGRQAYEPMRFARQQRFTRDRGPETPRCPWALHDPVYTQGQAGRGNMCSRPALFPWCPRIEAGR